MIDNTLNDMSAEEFEAWLKQQKPEPAPVHIDGWACWVGPSGTRYASPKQKDFQGVVSPLSDLSHVPSRVRSWLSGTVLGMPTGTCVGCKCVNCVIEDPPYCCKRCREASGNA